MRSQSGWQRPAGTQPPYPFPTGYSLPSKPAAAPSWGAAAQAPQPEVVEAPQAEEPKSYGAAPAVKPKKIRRASPLLAICGAIVVPWLAFAVVHAMMSFNLHYTAPGWCWTVVALFSLIFLVLGVMGAIRAVRNIQMETLLNEWVIFIAVSGLVAVVCGAILGSSNFYSNMRAFYDIDDLNTYHSVDPSFYRGNSLMDAGKFYFTQETHVNLQYSMGFVSYDTYCAAPIVKSGTTPETYDFWAVGKNCCSGGSSQDFRCGEILNPSAHAGLRVTKEEERAFYRLVVEQAEAAYNLKANHPVFLYWTQEPETELRLFTDDGNHSFVRAVLIYLLCQFLVTVCAVLLFAKV